MRKTTFEITLLALLHCLLLLAIEYISFLIWGKWGGVHYGFTLYYTILFLSVSGLISFVLFRTIHAKYAILVALTLIAGIGWFLYPGQLVPSYIALFSASTIFVLLYWGFVMSRR